MDPAVNQVITKLVSKVRSSAVKDLPTRAARLALDPTNTDTPLRVKLDTGYRQMNSRKLREYRQHMLQLCSEHNLQLEEGRRHTLADMQKVPIAVVVPDRASAFSLCAKLEPGAAENWQWLVPAAERVRDWLQNHGETATVDAALIARVLRCCPDAATCSAALEAAAWMLEHPGTNPRDVPTAPHSKWVEQHTELMGLLLPAGTAAAGTIEQTSPTHKIPVSLRWLDPTAPLPHVLAWHELEPHDPRPQRLLIVENLQTWAQLPELPGTLALYGAGHAAAQQLARMGWVQRVPIVVYWGDLDLPGLQTLSNCRALVPGLRSALMDDCALEETSNWASTPLKGHATTRMPEHLTTAEQAAWCRLADPRSSIRQIEQERVPTAIAERMLKAALGL